MGKFSCTSSHSLILSAISYLEEKGLETSAKGLYDILLGIHKDPKAKELACYGHYSQLGSRTFHSRIRLLERYGYLSYRYEKEIDDYVLSLKEKGRGEVRKVNWHNHESGKTNLLEIKEKI